MSHIRQNNAPLTPNLSDREALPQRLVAFARDLNTGTVLPFHHHRRAQLVYAASGVMSVTTRSSTYLVPPQRAVWMPGGIEHQIDARSDLAMRSIYLDMAGLSGFPDEVTVLQISPLLRELILSAMEFSDGYESDSPQERQVAVILDQIRAQPAVRLGLPMPTDARLVRITDALSADPGNQRDLNSWAHRVGASQRTLNRLFPEQTGLTFRQWRTQCRLLRSLELLNAGISVTNTADEVGYENASAFIAMFRRLMGETPYRYMNKAG